MSTILKALRRLEHEKSARSERPLREQVANVPEPKRGISMTFAVGGIFAAGLALGVLALVFWPRSASELITREDPAAVAASPPPASSIGRPPPSAPPVKRAQDLPKQAFESPVAVVEHTTPPEDETTVMELTAAPPRTDGPPEGIRPAAEAMKPRHHYRPPAPPKPQARPSRPASAGSLAAAAESAAPAPRAPLPEGVRVASANRPAPPPAEAPQIEAPAPDPPIRVAQPPENPPVAPTAPAAEAPSPARSAIPEITPRLPESKPAPSATAQEAPPVQPTVSIAASDPAPPVESVQVARTLWHPIPEKRVAVVEVDGRPGSVELHEGDLVGTLVVETIQPSAVVFLRDGVEVRQPVGTGR